MEGESCIATASHSILILNRASSTEAPESTCVRPYYKRAMLQALLMSYKVHLKRLSAPKDHKRYGKLAKNMR